MTTNRIADGRSTFATFEVRHGNRERHPPLIHGLFLLPDHLPSWNSSVSAAYSGGIFMCNAL
jgi:hypothetical protein